MLNVLSEVCMISVLLYWPTPLALKAFTLDLYVLLKWSPSTVQMVSVPTYTSCKDTQCFLLSWQIHQVRKYDTEQRALLF